jgi:DNA-binding MarR family transcriptional regulator
MPRTTPDPPPEHTPHSRLAEAALHGVVGYQLAQAAIVTSQVFHEAVGSAHGLRPVEYTVLALVDANPGLTARQLARALALTPPNIAAWLERLETRGLVARQRSESDARKQHIHASAGGHRLAAQCTRALLQAEAAALAGLSAAERAMLVELLHKAALTRRRGAG